MLANENLDGKANWATQGGQDNGPKGTLKRWGKRKLKDKDGRHLEGILHPLFALHLSNSRIEKVIGKMEERCRIEQNTLGE